MNRIKYIINIGQSETKTKREKQQFCKASTEIAAMLTRISLGLSWGYHKGTWMHDGEIENDRTVWYAVSVLPSVEHKLLTAIKKRIPGIIHKYNIDCHNIHVERSVYDAYHFVIY
jgi:hypothetical protein